jgi:DNA-binding NtrC family response regulator
VRETGRVERLGSNRERQVKVRVVSATNADLGAMIRAGSFREDLYYRLNLIELALPPLAERPGDILPLAEHFLGAARTLGEPARTALLRHAWPGNVRELKNTMQRAALLARGPVIEPADLGLPMPAGGHASATDAEPDREAIERALAASSGVVAQAAAELGLSRQALYRRMERLGIARP